MTHKRKVEAAYRLAEDEGLDLSSLGLTPDETYDLLVKSQNRVARVMRVYPNIVHRVHARFLAAARLPSNRQEAVKHTHPVNKPKGIDPDIAADHGRGVGERGDAVKPAKRDLRPEDVFSGTPNQMAVRNLAETGRDLSRALDKQIPKDKGYDAVSNLSQYLIETAGGGSGTPVKRR